MIFDARDFDESGLMKQAGTLGRCRGGGDEHDAASQTLANEVA